MTNTTIKQVLVLRKDLNMRKGKMAAQASHASMAPLFGRSLAKKETNRMEQQLYPLQSMRTNCIGLKRFRPKLWLGLVRNKSLWRFWSTHNNLVSLFHLFKMLD